MGGKENEKSKSKIVQHDYQPGEKVKYWSASHNRWCPATVLKKNDNGTWDLNVKPATKAKMIRPYKEPTEASKEEGSKADPQEPKEKDVKEKVDVAEKVKKKT